MADLGVEDVRLNYSLGYVVMARVVGCEQRRNRHVLHNDNEAMYYYQLRLSLKTVVEEKAENETAPSSGAVADKGGTKDLAVVLLAAGSFLMPKQMKVLQLVPYLCRVDRRFLPGYAVVSIKSKFLAGTSGDATVEFKLPYKQLLNSHGDELSDPPLELDGIAQGKLTVGRRIDTEGFVLSVPHPRRTLPELHR